MTEQILDTCTFDGKQWQVEEWDGSIDCISLSESSGFQFLVPDLLNHYTW